jgi:hypothetical protein
MATLESAPSAGAAFMQAGDQPRGATGVQGAKGGRGQVLAQAECYVALDGRKISLESELVGFFGYCLGLNGRRACL